MPLFFRRRSRVGVTAIRALYTRGDCRWHGRQPPILVRPLTGGDSHVLALDLQSQRARLAVGDRNPVDGADWRDLRGGPGEEQLVGDIEHLARHRLLDHLETHVAGNPDDGVARYAVEDRRTDGRCEKLPIANDEEIFSAAFRN